MYLTKVSVQKSDIEGEGVFAAEDIKEGRVTWKFDAGHDQVLSPQEFTALLGSYFSRLVGANLSQTRRKFSLL